MSGVLIVCMIMVLTDSQSVSPDSNTPTNQTLKSGNDGGEVAIATLPTVTKPPEPSKTTVKQEDLLRYKYVYTLSGQVSG